MRKDVIIFWKKVTHVCMYETWHLQVLDVSEPLSTHLKPIFGNAIFI